MKPVNTEPVAERELPPEGLLSPERIWLAPVSLRQMGAFEVRVYGEADHEPGDVEFVRADVSGDKVRELLDRWTQPCAADCEHSQCPLLRELWLLVEQKRMAEVLARAQQTVQPIIDKEKEGEQIGDLMSLRLHRADVSGDVKSLIVAKIRQAADACNEGAKASFQKRPPDNDGFCDVRAARKLDEVAAEIEAMSFTAPTDKKLVRNAGWDKIQALRTAATNMLQTLAPLDWPYIFSAPHNGGEQNVRRLQKAVDFLERAAENLKTADLPPLYTTPSGDVGDTEFNRGLEAAAKIADEHKRRGLKNEQGGDDPDYDQGFSEASQGIATDIRSRVGTANQGDN